MNQADVLKLFTYSKGNLYYKVSNSPRVKVGQIAGTVKPDGYVRVKIDKKLYYLHRLIWLYHYGVWPTEIDHIDRNPSNNAVENLREVSRSVNMRNTKLKRATTSKYKGVCWNARLNKWVAQATVVTKNVYLGVFTDEVEASKAYNNYIKDLV